MSDESILQEMLICETCQTCMLGSDVIEHICNVEEVSIEEVSIPKSQRKQLSGLKQKFSDNAVELLIGLVHSRTPLWDHRLPLSQRGKNEKDKLWAEIWRGMGCTFIMSDIQEKWRNLRDQFIKSKAQVEASVPSGSGYKIPKKIWKHYESLTFLHDALRQRQTTSNLALSGNVPSGSSSNHLETTSTKKRKQEQFEESLLKILEKPVELPPIPENKVSPSMLLADSLLNKLPMRVRMKAEREFINKLYELVEEHDVV